MQPLVNATVYIVDDDAEVRDALAWLLRSRRLLSEGFASAEAFEAMLQARTVCKDPACVLLDVRMPGMSGLALFDRLEARGVLPALPVIFLTGHADVPLAVAALKMGAADFLEKPFDDAILIERVEAALARYWAAKSVMASSMVRVGAKKVTPVLAVEKSRMRSYAPAGSPTNMRCSIFSITHRRRE